MAGREIVSNGASEVGELVVDEILFSTEVSPLTIAFPDPMGYEHFAELILSTQVRSHGAHIDFKDGPQAEQLRAKLARLQKQGRTVTLTLSVGPVTRTAAKPQGR